MAETRNVAAPNLPIAPDNYVRVYHDQHNNVLRLFFNQLINAVNGLLSRVKALESAGSGGGGSTTGAYLYAAGQTLGSTTANNITWGSELYDTGNYWTSGANINIDTTGWYSITATIIWALGTGGYRRTDIQLENPSTGFTTLATVNGPQNASVITAQNVSTSCYFTSGDIVRIRCIHADPNPLAILASSTVSVVYYG